LPASTSASIANPQLTVRRTGQRVWWLSELAGLTGLTGLAGLARWASQA
jgi:hypothetical protein